MNRSFIDYSNNQERTKEKEGDGIINCTGEFKMVMNA